MKYMLPLLLLSSIQVLSAQTFTEGPFSPHLEGIMFSSVAFSDVDGDGDEDAFVLGINTLNETISRLYINDGMGEFTEASGTSFQNVSFGSVAFADVNGDRKSVV